MFIDFRLTKFHNKIKNRKGGIMRVFDGTFIGLRSDKPIAAIFQVQGLEGVTEVEAVPFYEGNAADTAQSSNPAPKNKQLKAREAQLRRRLERLSEYLKVSVDLSDCRKVEGQVRGQAALESISGTNLRVKFLALRESYPQFKIGECAEFLYREKRMLVEISTHPWLRDLLPQEGGLVCIEVIDLTQLDSKRCKARIIDIENA
jgi:hypothetical protein